MEEIAEPELIARCRQGDASAWEELFCRHYAAVGRFVFQLASDFTREDVEEICQEAFLLVIRHLASFQGQCQFQTWLFRLAANKARDYHEKRRAAKRGGGVAPVPLDPPEEGTPAVELAGNEPAPDDVLIHQERALLLTRGLRELGSPCQELIELRYFGEASYEEIGAALRLNPKTVSSRLSRCLDRLEERLGSVLKAEVEP